VNTGGTINIARACKRAGIPIIYASTCCAYGSNPEVPWTEESATMPTEIYAWTKLWGEQAIQLINDKWVIFRLATMVGENQRDTLVTEIFIQQAMELEKYTVNGDGSQRRNWVDVEDAA
jgi:nucleoside-diphosphate-sugar epimerase